MECSPGERLMIRTLIADDEPLALRALEQLLGAHADVEIVGACRDGAEVQSALGSCPVDLLLLDIRMPELSGLDVAALLGTAPPLIVFVTAHETFGVPAFERDAIDYLLKPVTQPRLDRALDRVRTRLATEHDAARYRSLDTGSTPAPARSADRLVARVGDRDVIIPVEEIDLIAADDVYAVVHSGGRRYLLRTPLDELERMLSPERFLRVHRSFIVPVSRVAAVRRSAGSVLLELLDGVTVPVSRRRRGQVARLAGR
jgi:two-component system LytT family response regulator